MRIQRCTFKPCSSLFYKVTLDLVQLGVWTFDAILKIKGYQFQQLISRVRNGKKCLNFTFRCPNGYIIRIYEEIIKFQT